jgi:hypothetical protein
LKEFRKICDVKTICMHGNPLSKWTNKDVWDKIIKHERLYSNIRKKVLIKSKR